MEAISTFKDLSAEIWSVVNGEKTLENQQLEKLDAQAVAILKETDGGVIQAFSKKLMNINVMDKKVSFKCFDYMPNTWHKLYNTSVNIVAAAIGQMISIVED